MIKSLIPDQPTIQQAADDQVRNRAEDEVLRQLRGIRFGQLTLQIHDGRIVMIEKTTKLRFDAHAATSLV